eukprot:7233267-Pyramimonas_sp.AAC.1
MWYGLRGASCVGSFAAAHGAPTRRPRAGTRGNLGGPTQRAGRPRLATNGAPGEAQAGPSDHSPPQVGDLNSKRC